MNFTDKNIYELLPSYYRVKDYELGYVNKDGETIGPLKELIEIIARQAGIAEKNIGELYDNWFIETCKEWTVPYISDLLGVRSLNTVSGSASVISQRAYVANTISYRRRKGIAPVLEQLALDVAGWRAHVVEFFEFLCTTQYMNHIRLHRPVGPDLRKMDQLDLVSSPFDTIAHTVDVRHISNGRGKYNIPNIGLFVWRLQSYPVIFSEPVKLPCTSNPGEFFYTFDPIGDNIHLFNKPKTETSITHISAEVNVPGLLRSRVLLDELEGRRQAWVDKITPQYNFFDDRNEIEVDDTTKRHSVFEIYTRNAPGNFELVPPEEVMVCNMKNCCTVPTELAYKKLEEDGSYIEVIKNITVAVDPVMGRFKFSNPGTFDDVRVSYSYGFSGDLGAGTYDRQDTIAETFRNKNVWQVGVSKSIQPEATETIHTSIQLAVDDWNNNAPQDVVGVIVIMDNCSYSEALDIKIKEKSQLLIVAADWPIRDKTDGSGKERRSGDIMASDLRPHLNNNITVTGLVSGIGTDVFTKKEGGELTINGLLIEGKLSVKKGNLGSLNIVCSTLIPVYNGIEIGVGISSAIKKLSNQWLKLSLKRTICGPVLLHMTPLDSLETEDCIIDNAGNWAIKSEATPVQLRRTTFFGNVIAKIIDAENCIFNNDVKSIRRQTGCIRYSYVAIKNTDTPQRYRCQPDLEITTQTEEAEKAGALSLAEKNLIKQNVAAWLVPVLTSTHYGHHAYAQLASTCPEQIGTGAENGSEMGAFSFLMNPQRVANLRIALDEYLRLGLEAGIFFAT